MQAYPFVSAESTSGPASRFRVSVDIDILDMKALWLAAAQRGRNFAGLDDDDIEDVIGPVEDPDFAACLSMLMSPVAPAGCQAVNFTTEAAQTQFATLYKPAEAAWNGANAHYTTCD